MDPQVDTELVAAVFAHLAELVLTGRVGCARLALLCVGRLAEGVTTDDAVREHSDRLRTALEVWLASGDGQRCREFDAAVKRSRKP
jgi:hypothetical protein